jgi:hypothetical protein
MPLAAIAISLLLALQTGKVSIEGTVISATTNKPIAGAQVTLIKTAAPPASVGTPGIALGVVTGGVLTGTLSGVISNTTTPAIAVQGGALPNRPTATTDAGGHFVFSDLDPGTYIVQAAADGYARQQFGLPPSGQTGMSTSVTVAPGQPGNAVLHLTAAGNVSGRVTGANGEPVVGMDVALLRVNYTMDGRKNVQQVGTAQTNDKGEYRLFWVPPGRYYLTVSPSNRLINPGLLLNTNNNSKYSRSFYPGVADMAAASPVEILPGGELNGMDFRLSQSPTFHVKGRIVDAATGQAPANVSISITPREQVGGGIFSSSGPYNRADGTFQLNDVFPGSYWIRAQLPLTARPQPGDGPPRPPSAAVAVDVSGSDIENVVVTIYPPVSISGRVRVDGVSNPSLDRMRVWLQPPAPGPLLSAPPPPAAVNADGTFVIANVLPGDYQVTIPNPLPGPAGSNAGQILYVKEARFGAIDALTESMSIAGPVSDQLQIVLAADGAKVTGSVANDRQQLVPQIQILLLPALRERRDLYKVGRTDATGHFTLPSVPPGSYKAFAIDPLWMDSFFDPAVLAKLESKGTAITVGSSATLNVDLKFISGIQ